MRTLGYFLKSFFAHENIKKLASKVAYFSFSSAVLVLPKSARSAQTVENPHSFFNVSYTWYKSMFLAFQDRYVDEAEFKTSGGVSGYIARAKNLMDTRKLYTEAIGWVSIFPVKLKKNQRSSM